MSSSEHDSAAARPDQAQLSLAQFTKGSSAGPDAPKPSGATPGTSTPSREEAPFRLANPTQAELDQTLTAQLIVAWAGEAGEEKRLGWWRSDLVSEFGGEDLFRRLLPNTFPWAVFQGARETARRRDAELRKQDHDPDRILSLFSFGFELDEHIEERFQTLKQLGKNPHDVLPGLRLMARGWNRTQLQTWIHEHGTVESTPTPTGRRIKGLPPGRLELLVSALVAGLAPLTETYPLPHYRRPS